MSNRKTFIDVIKIGISLLFKENKTKEEIIAGKSFRNSFLKLFFIIFIWIVLFTAVVIAFYPSRGFDGIKRYGVVEGNNVKYQQKENKYLSLRSLGLEGKNLKDGDSVLLFFESNDGKTINAITKSDYQKITGIRFCVIIVTAIAGISVLTTSSMSLKKTTGKDFYEFIDNNSY